MLKILSRSITSNTAIMAVTAIAFTALLRGSAAPTLVGTYLPESELPKNVCALHGINVREEVTFYNKDNMQVGEKKIEQLGDLFYCSATVFQKDAILTAAHCFEGVLTYKPRLTKMKDGVFARVQMRMDRSEIRCPGVDGKPEVFTTEVADGWPHPRFGNTAERTMNDIAVLKIKGEFKTPPMPAALDRGSVRQILENGAKTCRIFGYGRDNAGKGGTLHGIRAPNIFWTPDVIEYIGTDGAEPGDSGGALICKDERGVDHLVGITSKKGDRDPSTPKRQSIFVPTDAFTSWVKFALNHSVLNHESALEFTFQELEEENDELKACLQRKISEGTPRAYTTDLKKFAAEADQLISKQKQNLRAGTHPAGVVRIYLDKAAEKIIYNQRVCEQLTRGQDSIRPTYGPAGRRRR